MTVHNSKAKLRVVSTKDFGARTVHATDLLAEKVKTARLPTRAQQMNALRNKSFDILVVGGGATGCGVALDAASRGRHSYCSRSVMTFAHIWFTL